MQVEKYKLPNFLIVGAAKAGTTSLANYLNEHSKIYIPPIKECRFLSNLPDGFGPSDYVVNQEKIKSIEEYSKLMSNAKEEQLAGDASVDYLYFHQNVISNINKYFKKIPKIIILLRSPVKRAFSMYSHLKMGQREKLSFIEAIKEIPTRKQKQYEWSWDYIGGSMYYEAAKAYLKAFGKENVQVIIFEEFVKNKKETVNEIIQFIGIQNLEPINVDKTYNISGKPKIKTVQALSINKKPHVRLIKKMIPKTIKQKVLAANIAGKYQIEKEETEFASQFFEEDIKSLEKLLNKNLQNLWQV